MRIWDVQPGYLNRESLLGEHRELHGIVSIIKNRKRGYASHPETLRWVGRGWALRQRHQLLSAEMELRGYQEQSPVNLRQNTGCWPERYLDSPLEQYRILGRKYIERKPGRIPLPCNAQELWQQHKYSVMARNVELYRSLGRRVSNPISETEHQQLALLLVETLRLPPSPGGIRNTLLHMWGYVSDQFPGVGSNIDRWGNGRLLREIQRITDHIQQPYLLSSTALSELRIWI